MKFFRKQIFFLVNNNIFISIPKTVLFYLFIHLFIYYVESAALFMCTFSKKHGTVWKYFVAFRFVVADNCQ